MKTTCLTLFLCLGILLSYGQTSYTFFVDDSLMKVKYAKEVDNIKETKIKSLDKKYIKDYKEIYTESFTNIKELILSKESITDTAINNYLQRIVQEIVQKNKELSNLKLRIIFTRNLCVNAYSMGDGTIAVNAGIIYYLKNEAELAFIISHELAHYYLDHSGKAIEKYVTTINSEDYQKELKAIAKKKFGVNKELDKLAKGVVFNSRKHSRTHEAEADYYAYKFMSNSMFNLNSVITSLQMLDKIEDTSIFKPLKIDVVLNSPEYPFKKKWIQEETSIFSEIKLKKDTSNKNEADSLKTHPDCTKRIALLKDTIAKSVKKSSPYFITNEITFNKIKEKFLMEAVEYCYTNKQLSLNLYLALSMFQDKKETPYAVYSIARCLNVIFEKQKKHTLGNAIHTENKDFEDDYNQLLRMLSSLSLSEIAAINYNFCKTNLSTGLLYKNFDKEWKIAQLNQTNN
jgi:Zn-dependent protease with chaperone function